MNERLIAILLELHSEYEHGPAAMMLIEEALALVEPRNPMHGCRTEEDAHGVRSLRWNDSTSGVPWLAYIVRPGERYGAFSVGTVNPKFNEQRCLTNVDRCQIEFWDCRFSHDLVHKAQFVTRYYVSTLHRGAAGGLVLDGSIVPWRLDAASMALVKRYLLDSITVVEGDK